MPEYWETYFLVGCTATGKTAVAHELARRMGLPVLSADSMLVYRGMDIGSAKPTPEECEGLRIRGMNLVNPDEACSTAIWLEEAYSALNEAAEAGLPVIVAGGTGLYVNSLLQGLSSRPPDLKRRKELEEICRSKGLNALCALAEQLRPGSTAHVQTENPRRVIRLIEHLEAGIDLPADNGSQRQKELLLTGLSFDRAALIKRIERRAEGMFANGLPEETERLRASFPGFIHSTAGAGIGYAEALALLDGTMTRTEAVERTSIRTRQLAKRQATWWRTQLSVDWVQGPESSLKTEIARAADEIQEKWRKYGPIRIPRRG